MDENMINDFLISKWKWIEYVIKACLVHDIDYVYVMEEFYNITLKSLV